jgi:hypothetical protein
MSVDERISGAGKSWKEMQVELLQVSCAGVTRTAGRGGGM